MDNDSIELVKSLLRQLVISFSLRDWEDSFLDKALKERKSLMKQIVNLGEPAIDPVIELLGHSDLVVRENAALMLGYIKNTRAEKPLLAAMLNDKNIVVQRSAASALERISTQEATLAVQSWYRNNGASPQQRIAQKINEYITYGETDEMLIKRANELAMEKGVTIDSIFKARLFMFAEKPPLTPEQEAIFYKSLGVPELTSQDCTYLDELYKIPL